MEPIPHDKNVYTDNGYKDRKVYLNSLADNLGITRTAVYMIADVPGESEDFDGLITALEDFAESEGGT